MTEKFTFITPFFEWHGIGFLDVILQAMNDAYEKNDNIPSAEKLFDSYEMHNKFSQKGELRCLKKVMYLLPKNFQAVLTAGRASRWKEFVSKEKQKSILESIKRTSKNDAETSEDLKTLVSYFNINEDKSFPNYQWLQKNWRHCEDLWHIINEFSIETQIAWYKDNSLIYKNSQQIEFVELDIDYEQLDDEYKTATALRDWLAKQDVNTHTYVNLWGSKTSFQIAFHYLSWSSPRFKSAHFIKCINEKKSNDKQRLTPIKIVLAKKDLLETLCADDMTQFGLSDQQKETYRWLEKYREFGDNFTILLLGPRGIGKTKVVGDVYAFQEKEKVINVNCAQFQSNPELARSELFGHEKGAFTGAIENKSGAFSLADKNTLFLDEIHHLDKATQSLLLTALQTDDKGFFSFTPLGGNKPKNARFQLITATNQTIEQLQEIILPDLFDRITQRTLEFSPLQSGEAISDEFIHVWEKMEFKKSHNPIVNDNIDKSFMTWLTNEERVFAGNYRDLQKIAILCADYQRCTDLLPKNTSLVKYVELNWKQTMPRRPNEVSIENFLDEHNNISLKEIANEFKAKVVRAAELYSGDIKTAAKMLGISPKNLIEIKNRVKISSE